MMPRDSFYGGYSALTEQQQANAYGSMDAFYQGSEGNVKVYTSNNSPVIRNDGIAVPSIPAMASMYTMMSGGDIHHPHLTSFRGEQFSPSLHSNSALAFSDDAYSPYAAGNLLTTLKSPLTGHLEDHYPNETSATDMFGADVFQSNMPASEYFSGYGASNMDPGQGSGGTSYMVTGIGADCGEEIGFDNEILQWMDQFDPVLPQCDPVPVLEGDSNISDILRKLEEPTPYLSSSGNPRVDQLDLETFQNIHVPFDFLSATISSDYLGEPVQVQPRDMIALESHPWNRILEPAPPQSAVEDDLDLIKMMRTTSKPLPPKNLRPLPPQNLVLECLTDAEETDLVSDAAAPISVKPESITLSKSLTGPFPPAPATPHNITNYGIQTQTPICPIQVSTPFPGSPLTPATPEILSPPLRKGPFEIKCYQKEHRHIVEVGISNDVPDPVKKVAYNMNRFSSSLCLEYEKCMSKDFDLNMAISTRAAMCDFDFDPRTGGLSLSMPSECMQLDTWLSTHREKVDLLDRHLVLQQVANLLASIHTLSGPDKLCLWGSFVVWVSPSKQVYIQVDFPEMLAKMEGVKGNSTFDPRIEDVKALYEIYKSVLQPFIKHASSWVSPDVKQLLLSFEAVVVDPTSVYRMAELARILGERRLCRLEVEIITIIHYVYCIEHEPLCKVLSHFEHMLPQVTNDGWEVQWMNTGLPVTKDVVASAHRSMYLRVAPKMSDPYVTFKPEQRVLGFKQE